MKINVQKPIENTYVALIDVRLFLVLKRSFLAPQNVQK